MIQGRRFTADYRKPEGTGFVSHAGKELCLVFGNCQADPLRLMLATSPAFRSRFRSVPVSPVHLITDEELKTLQNDLLPRTSLLIIQNIRPGYRGRPLGTREIVELVPEDCTVLTWVSLFYQGLFPFQVVIQKEEIATDKEFAPLTLTQDLRFLYCAKKGWSTATASAWLAEYVPPTDVVRQVASDSAVQLAQREEGLDIQVADQVTGTSVQGFFMMSHPTNYTLSEVSRRIHEALDLPFVTSDVDELLSQFRTPVEPAIVEALGLDFPSDTNWLIFGEQYSIEELMSIHLDWYRQKPFIVRLGLEQYRERAALLGLD